MELLQHVVHLAVQEEAGDCQVVRARSVEDLVYLAEEAPLVEQALNAHLNHELDGGLHAEADLLPAARLQGQHLQVFVRSVHVQNIAAVEHEYLVRLPGLTRAA